MGTSYHKNGKLAWSGSTAYHDNGKLAWSGATAYHSNGKLALSGSTAYHDNGKLAGGEVIEIEQGPNIRLFASKFAPKLYIISQQVL